MCFIFVLPRLPNQCCFVRERDIIFFVRQSKRIWSTVWVNQWEKLSVCLWDNKSEGVVGCHLETVICQCWILGSGVFQVASLLTTDHKVDYSQWNMRVIFWATQIGLFKFVILNSRFLWTPEPTCFSSFVPRIHWWHITRQGTGVPTSASCRAAPASCSRSLVATSSERART